MINIKMNDCVLLLHSAQCFLRQTHRPQQNFNLCKLGYSSSYQRPWTVGVKKINNTWYKKIIVSILLIWPVILVVNVFILKF